MLNAYLLYAGSLIISVWGIAHLIPTRNVVKGFGELSTDNRLVITMEWVIEGLSLIFAGVLVALATFFLGAGSQGAQLVSYSVAAFLLILAITSMFTGARTSVIPMKLCPAVKTLTAALFVAGNIL